MNRITSQRQTIYDLKNKHIIKNVKKIRITHIDSVRSLFNEHINSPNKNRTINGSFHENEMIFKRPKSHDKTLTKKWSNVCTTTKRNESIDYFKKKKYNGSKFKNI